MPASLNVRELNDAFRSRGPVGGNWFLTPGVQALGPQAGAEAVSAVQAFADFNHENDPHHEHDFGVIHISGERLFWKIDYYDLSFEFGSPDPTDPGMTKRVMTILLASEY